MTFRIRNTIKRSLFVGLFLGMMLPFVSAQFDAQHSQYMFNMPAFNPASIGESGMINVTGHYRLQWVTMPGAPKTLNLGINSPFKISDKAAHGVGIKFLRDEIGAFINQTAHFQYAYKRDFGKNRLSIGADIGFVSVGFIADSVKADVNSEFHDFLGDTAIPTADDTGMSFDLSLGAFYSTPKYYLGVSYVHLNAPRIKLNDDRTQFNVKGVAFVTGGYDLSFRDPKWQLRSSALVKSDLTSWQAEVSSRVEYDQKFWGGLSYRYQDAAVVFLGANLISGMTLGVSYDMPASKLIKASWGSLEFLLSYNFAFDFGNKGRYKSIRIL